MPDKTQAAVLVELNQPLEIMNLTLPALGKGQVLVEMAYSGICHSQLHEIRGRRGPDRFLPHTLGHEGSGKVLAVGEGVTKVKTGDPVVLSWIKGSGAEVPSVTYQSPKGKVNSGAISTFMKLAVISENRVFKIPAKLSLRDATLLGCAFPTGAGMIRNTLNVQPGSTVVIFGAGGIGLCAIMAAAAISNVKVAAVDIVDEKLALAKKFGATLVIRGDKEDTVKTLRDWTNGKGMDYAVECAGRKATMEQAFECVRDQGGTCVLGGNLAQGEKISIDPFHLIRGKKIIGTWGGETVPDRDIPQYADMALQGALKLGDLISHEFPLSSINEAVTALEQGRVSRAILTL